jgi:hypothetical protein
MNKVSDVSVGFQAWKPTGARMLAWNEVYGQRNLLR